MNGPDSPEASSPLWRNPVMWLVVGLPLLSIVAGVGLVVVATRSGGADAVSDPVRRVAQIQTSDLGPDAAARKQGLSAVLRVEDGVVEVLPATGTFARDRPLRLELQHPTRQAEDLHLELAPAGPAPPPGARRASPRAVGLRRRVRHPVPAGPVVSGRR